LGAGLFAGDRLFVNEPGTSDAIPSEALFVTVQSAGTYYASVDLASAPGNYRLSATVFPHEQAGAGCTTYSSTDFLPKTIPAGPALVTSVLYVPGSPTIADLQVSLGIQHGNPPELSVLLTAPGGNTVALLTNAGSPSFPDLDVTLDRSAAFPAGWRERWRREWRLWLRLGRCAAGGAPGRRPAPFGDAPAAGPHRLVSAA